MSNPPSLRTLLMLAWPVILSRATQSVVGFTDALMVAPLGESALAATTTGAFDTFAVSRDLVHWTKWSGPDLIAPSEPWDREYAHKPWLVRHEDTVYHFYCAVGTEGRVIALATSRDLRPARTTAP